MARIIVTGDIVEDHYLLKYPMTPRSYGEPSPPTLLQTARGGAHYLASLIKLSCADRRPEIDPSPQTEGIRRAYSIFSTFPTKTGEKTQVWRISSFLGCQRPIGTLNSSGVALSIKSDDILVIDDLGLGFLEQAQAAPWAAGPGCAAIVLKTSGPPGENALLRKMLHGSARGRVTLIVPANALRVQGATLPYGLSWDRTIEDIVREMDGGRTGQTVVGCRRVVVRFGLAGAAVFTREGEGALRFERFLYIPGELEGEFEKQHPGRTFGGGSFVTAAMVRHELDPTSFPLFVGLSRGLAAARTNHEVGAGKYTGARDGSNVNGFDLEAAVKSVAEKFLPAPDAYEPAGIFYSAFPHGILSCPPLRDQPPTESNLLRDFTGAGIEYVAARATEVVLRGPEKALEAAPRARYGSFFTVDREEIERINGIRRLAEDYLKNPSDRRPLSIAVFGPPGSGKSFAIKQLAEVLFGEKREPLTFNVSGFGRESLPRLQEAFHRVRDASIRGEVPLVFWDEFDSDELAWLKHFLAPMQDAEFRAESLVYPIGRALFVFAGGTRSSFQEFKSQSDAGGANGRDKKLPDFISRLRGILDIKGPNPAVKSPQDDPAHVLRRAILLRSVLERFYPDLIDASQVASIGPGVVRGFLRVREYLHGARSLESLVHASRLAGAVHFGPSELPPPDLLGLYVSPDFLDRVADGELAMPVVERLAEAAHQDWKELREKDGWAYGPERDDKTQKHNRLINYDNLTEAWKEDNRNPARVTTAKLAEVGYMIAPRNNADAAPTALPEDVRQQLMRSEHDIWLRDHLLRGYEHSETTNERLRLHRSVAHIEELTAEDRKLDEANIRHLPQILWDAGYELVRGKRESGSSPAPC